MKYLEFPRKWFLGCRVFARLDWPLADVDSRGTKSGAVTLCSFSHNLCRNAIARQIARIIAQCNIPCNGLKRCQTIAETVAESRIEFYFPQRLQQIFLSIAQCNICPATCVEKVCGTSQWKCSFNLIWSSKRDKLHDTLLSVTLVKQLVSQCENVCRNGAARKVGRKTAQCNSAVIPPSRIWTPITAYWAVYRGKGRVWIRKTDRYHEA